MLNLPAYLDEQLRYEHQMNIEAQRDLLRQRGFPASHPLVAGEIPIHPELVGHLHFGRPNQTTVALNHDDFMRFLPEMQRKGMQSSFPKSTSDLHKLTEVRGVPSGGGWAPGDNQTRRGQERSRANRSRSTEARHQAAAGRPRSMFNPLSGRADRGDRGDRGDRKNINNEGGEARSGSRPRYGQETGDQVQVTNGRTDSGIGEELWRSSKHSHSDKTSSNKSSFGMILKDRFQKNPNMYFPDTSVTSVPSESGWGQISPGLRGKPGLKAREAEDWSDTDTLVHNMSEGSFDKVSIFFSTFFSTQIASSFSLCSRHAKCHPDGKMRKIG